MVHRKARGRREGRQKKRQRQECISSWEPVKIMSGYYKISSGTQKVEVTFATVERTQG